MDAATWLRKLEDTGAQAERRAKLAELAAFVASLRASDELFFEGATRVAAMFNAERAALFVIEANGAQLVTYARNGAAMRAPRDPSNVAGFVAATATPVSVKNALDAAELTKVHPALRWEEPAGARTRGLIAAPVLHEGNVVGVLLIANRMDDLTFVPRDLGYAEEVGAVLAPAVMRLGHERPAPPRPRYATPMGVPIVPPPAAPPALPPPLPPPGAAVAALPANIVEKAPPAPRASTRRAGKWDRLVESGVITHDGLDKATAGAAGANTDLARYLIEKIGINRADVEASLTAFFGVPFFRFTGKETVLADLRTRLRADFLKKMCAVPVERRGAQLVVVIDDPADIGRADALRAIDPEREVLIHVGFRDEIVACIEHSYGLRGDVGLLLKELSSDESTGAVDEITDEDGKGEESDSTIIKLANQIIIDAYRRGASDIHVEPNGKENNTSVRFRIDGECVQYNEIPPAFRNPLVARLKIMAKLDISERRKPQDGKIKFRMQDRTIELRVATLPTVNGNEDVVMRILAASKPIPIDEMGMSARNLAELKKIVVKPYGLILCVGPTGSGKTTTLHSALGHINTVDMKIWTAEDPVEITQPGLRQVQVQPKIGFDFATAMRAFLRADPDVIMVGEMRDKETASTGIEASLTGHLVFSTLHTNSAPETITRLIDMEIDPFSFADALLGVLAQRLARSLCKKCREEYVADADEMTIIINAFGEEAATARGYTRAPVRLYRSNGCEVCTKTGYKGRVALHELLINNDKIKHAITKHAPVEEIRQFSIEGGMTTLLQDGIEKAIAGRTDLKQVLAVCSK